jgi:hypothetical protein
MQAATASRASDAGRIRACIASFERSKAFPGGRNAKEKAFGNPCYITRVERAFGHDTAAPTAAALASGALAVAAATFLLELSRTLAERAKGRWYAGNGRDVFHGGAVAVLTGAFTWNGLHPAIAFFAAATVSIAPLLILDLLPPRRGPRIATLFALFALGSAPALVDPRSIEETVEAVARALFRSP